MSIRCKCGRVTDYGITCVFCSPGIDLDQLIPTDSDYEDEEEEYKNPDDESPGFHIVEDDD